MRVNVYAEEMTDKVEVVTKEAEGQTFTGIRFFTELPVTRVQMQVQGPFIHHDGDNDSSAVTFWGKRDLRDALRKALGLLDAHYAALEKAMETDGPQFDIVKPLPKPADVV